MLQGALPLLLREQKLSGHHICGLFRRPVALFQAAQIRAQRFQIPLALLAPLSTQQIYNHKDCEQ